MFEEIKAVSLAGKRKGERMFVRSLLIALVAAFGLSGAANANDVSINCWEVQEGTNPSFYDWLHYDHGNAINAKSGWTATIVSNTNCAGAEPGIDGATDWTTGAPIGASQTCDCEIQANASTNEPEAVGTCTQGAGKVLCVNGPSGTGASWYKFLTLSSSGTSGSPMWVVPKYNTGTPDLRRLSFSDGADYVYVYGMEVKDPHTGGGPIWEDSACVIIEDGVVGAHLVGSNVHDCSGDGIYVEPDGGALGDTQALVIANNTINFNGKNGARTLDSGTCTCDPDACGSTCIVSQTGGIDDNAGGAGIRVFKADCQLTSACVIEGNTILYNGEDGILVTGNNWDIKHNKVGVNGFTADGTTCDYGYSGIRTDSDGTHKPKLNTIDHNYVVLNDDPCFDGFGVLLDTESSASVVEYNVALQNHGPGYGGIAADNSRWEDNSGYLNAQNTHGNIPTDRVCEFLLADSPGGTATQDQKVVSHNGWLDDNNGNSETVEELNSSTNPNQCELDNSEDQNQYDSNCGAGSDDCENVWIDN